MAGQKAVPKAGQKAQTCFPEGHSWSESPLHDGQTTFAELTCLLWKTLGSDGRAPIGESGMVQSKSTRRRHPATSILVKFPSASQSQCCVVSGSKSRLDRLERGRGTRIPGRSRACRPDGPFRHRIASHLALPIGRRQATAGRHPRRTRGTWPTEARASCGRWMQGERVLPPGPKRIEFASGPSYRLAEWSSRKSPSPRFRPAFPPANAQRPSCP